MLRNPEPTGSLDGDTRRADRVQGLLGQEITVLGKGESTRRSFDPFDPRDGGVDDHSSGGRHLRSDAVARDQRDTVPSTHVGTLPDGLMSPD